MHDESPWDRGSAIHAALTTALTRLLTDGEQVVDVPPKLSARARVFATGQGRKTDATDAHSVALVGTRMAEGDGGSISKRCS